MLNNTETSVVWGAELDTLILDYKLRKTIRARYLVSWFFYVMKNILASKLQYRMTPRNHHQFKRQVYY